MRLQRVSAARGVESELDVESDLDEESDDDPEFLSDAEDDELYDDDGGEDEDGEPKPKRQRVKGRGAEGWYTQERPRGLYPPHDDGQWRDWGKRAEEIAWFVAQTMKEWKK